MRECAAILDIGSNAVRLAVYGGLSRIPETIYAERALCGLGARLARTGRLDPAGVEKAIAALKRFSDLLRAMGVTRVRAVATAAVRDAADGPAFIVRVAEDCGLAARTVSGAEEARLSALGVRAGGLCRDGIIGDYGGGSLELSWLEGGRLRGRASLPLGAHRLRALKTPAARAKALDAALKAAGFPPGLDFIALGGAWRAMGKMHLRAAQHPVPVIDHYALRGREAERLAADVARRGGDLPDMKYAALALSRVLKALKPGRVVFSAAGLREGLFQSLLSASVRREDPLLSLCRARAENPATLAALARFIAPLFAGEEAGTRRLIEAAALLSACAAADHENHQAEQAFRRALVLPPCGADHPGRAFLALALHARYGGEAGAALIQPVRKLAGPAMARTAFAAGLALRAGWRLSGGMPGLLKGASLSRSGGKIVLKPGRLPAGTARKELEALAKILGIKAAVQK